MLLTVDRVKIVDGLRSGLGFNSRTTSMASFGSEGTSKGVVWGKPSGMTSSRPAWINDLKNSFSHVDKLTLLLYAHLSGTFTTALRRTNVREHPFFLQMAISPSCWSCHWYTKAQF